jgi:hypothetical protein
MTLRSGRRKRFTDHHAPHLEKTASIKAARADGRCGHEAAGERITPSRYPLRGVGRNSMRAGADGSLEVELVGS